MISLGVDIEEVKRFQALIKNKKFLDRVFSNEEVSYCRSKKNRAQHFAVRFAAKEAVWKALSELLDRMNQPLNHRDISIRNEDSGKPNVVLPSALKSLERKLSVSLSHTHAYVVAAAILKD